MKDWILLALRAFAEGEAPIEHDITLLVGGFLVSGFIISYQKYMQHHPTMATLESFRQEEDARDQEQKKEVSNFIHLRDAKYYVPGGAPIPGNTGVFMRISLESVQGFTLGSLVAEQA